jgi:dihydrofolate synthase/folylpolyglutamate synthase
MTSDEALQYWFRRIDFERKTPRPGDLKLDRMCVLLERLGNPHEAFRILHLAGSKGKGSTAAMLDAILRVQGYRVGLFTSPHLEHVEERIRVDGEPIGRAELAAQLEEIHAAARAPAPGDDAPLNDFLTFFEIATAVGFLHFAARRVEWAVLEVGLGGRFDSTNVCVPEVAIVTSISFDHTETLGSTLAQIAMEKAGIIKPGRPTVSGVVDADARAVIEDRCRAVGSPLLQLGRDFQFDHEPAHINFDERPARVSVQTWRQSWQSLELNLVGAHQAANAALAVAAVECLRDRDVPLGDDAVARGLAGVQWPARLEILKRRPLIVLDCAHNVASALALREALLASFPSRGRRILIFAGSRDKDIAGMLAVLAPIFSDVIFTRFEQNPRAVPIDRLVELAPPDAACRQHRADHPAAALALAEALAQPDDLICVTGSVFLAGEFRPLLRGGPEAEPRATPLSPGTPGERGGGEGA